MSTYDLSAPIPNWNGRVYTREALRQAVEKAKPKIEAGQMIGEVEPPGDGRSRLSHASHVVRDMKVNRKGEIIGTIEVLDTPSGSTLKAMIERGLVYGSLRSEEVIGADGKPELRPISFDICMAKPGYEPSAVDQLADIVAEDEDDADR